MELSLSFISPLVAGEAERLRELMLLRLFKLLRFMSDVEMDVLLKDEVNAEGDVAVMVVAGCKSETETGPSLGALMLGMVDMGEDDSRLAMVGKRAGLGLESV